MTQVRRPENKLRIAAVQAGTKHGADGNPGFEANFSRLAGLARDAALERPDLIVFPEYSISGWPYPKGEKVNELAEPVPGNGFWYGRYAQLAKELDTALLCWLVEREGERLFSTAFLLERDGSFAGKYSKVQTNLNEQTLWGWSQADSFEPLNFRGFRVGVSICADMWFPETVLCESLLGADLIIHMSIADDMQDIIPVRAKDSWIPIVAAIFNGGSFAVDALGNRLAKASSEEAQWILFELEPNRIYTARKYGGLWIPKQGRLNQRRPSAYTVLTDPATRTRWTDVLLDDEGRPQTQEQLKRRYNGRFDADDPELYHIPLVAFAEPWTSPFRVDPEYRHHLINREGRHLFPVNKTAWAYFSCQDPEGVLRKARAQGVNVLRVCLEGAPYFPAIGYDLWPWLGTREQPDFCGFNETYWQQAEERVKLAGEHGIGLDVVLYMGQKPEAEDVPIQRTYWRETLRRFGKYANVLTWEIMNEYIANESFQDIAGAYMKKHDPYGRPVCSSDGTTDDALWPHKPWMDLAINHTCTSSTERHGLRDWYWALAANTRSHGKPSFCNESGREVRHRNDDPAHRRKQGWIWCSAGGFWTFHSWEGCEGIDDLAYEGPGGEFMKPMADFFQAMPFWRMDPNYTAFSVSGDDMLTVVLAEQERLVTAAYVCTLQTGERVSGRTARLRLPDGMYRMTFIDPRNGAMLEAREHRSEGIGQVTNIVLPDFTDDLAIRIDMLEKQGKSLIEGTL